LTCVLVVDDDPWIQWMIADDLVDRGYEVVTAQDGVEALQHVREVRPDVIVMDLLLPRLDGWELATRCRAVAGGVAIPIVVVSAARDPELPDASCGVRGHIRKPFDIEELARSVAALAGPESAPVRVPVGLEIPTTG
jgi:CheY-like chemotaxis protein